MHFCRSAKQCAAVCEAKKAHVAQSFGIVTRGQATNFLVRALHVFASLGLQLVHIRTARDRMSHDNNSMMTVGPT